MFQATRTLRAAHGGEAFQVALGRAVAFSRWRAADVRSILAAGPGTADPRPAGNALILEQDAIAVLDIMDQGFVDPALHTETVMVHDDAASRARSSRLRIRFRAVARRA